MSRIENLKDKALSFLRSLDEEQGLERQQLEAEKLEKSRQHKEAVSRFEVFEENLKTLRPELKDVLRFLNRELFEDRGQVQPWKRIVEEEVRRWGTRSSMGGMGMSSGNEPDGTHEEILWFDREVASLDFMPHLKIELTISRQRVDKDGKKFRSLYPKVPIMSLKGKVNGDLLASRKDREGQKSGYWGMVLKGIDVLKRVEKESDQGVGQVRAVWEIDREDPSEVVEEVKEELLAIVSDLFQP